MEDRGSIDPDVRVISFSGLSEPREVDGPYAEVLRKPLNSDELRDAVLRVLGAGR